jgi:hypothetical protein
LIIRNGPGVERSHDRRRAIGELRRVALASEAERTEGDGGQHGRELMDVADVAEQ